MEAFSALLDLCDVYPPLITGFSSYMAHIYHNGEFRCSITEDFRVWAIKAYVRTNDYKDNEKIPVKGQIMIIVHGISWT